MRNTLAMKWPVFASAAGLLMLGACGSLPERIETLDQARSAVEDLERDTLSTEVAPRRFEEARAALERADAAFEDRDELERIEDEAYVALRNAQIAQQQIEAYRAREELDQGEAERNRVVLMAREREAESAQQLAEQRGQRLEASEQQLEAQQEATVAARERATELEQRAEELEQSLADLEAEQTERGWVMTLEGVLFDFDRAELQPGADQTIDRLSEFLAANTDRNIVIEGHTDSRGDASYNRQLSRERAEAVRRALVDRGVPGNRIELRALGEEFPIATNESTAGRQLNRRVEIVLSDEGGQFEGRQRSAAAEPREETN